MKNTIMLKKNYEFREIFSKGKYYGGNFIEFFILKSQEDFNRLGIAVSKKVGNSVIRHRIRRLIKENYRNLEDSIITGRKLIILWKKSVEKEKATYYNIEKDLTELFQKAEMLRKSI